MFNVLLKIIPLDLATILGSPGILALALVILASKNHPKAHILSLFFGSLIIGLGVTILGFVLGNSIDTGIKQNFTESIIDIILGLFFIFYGIKLIFSKERRVDFQEEKHELKIFKWFGVGLVITITNFDALFLNFTAAKEVGGANVQELAKWILLVVNLSFFTLPITLPLILQFIFPKFSQPILVKINYFVLKYSRYIIFGMFLIFGLYFLYRGLNFFL